MDSQQAIKNEIVENLKRILKVSLPHCKDDNPNEDVFIEINRLAHESLQRVEVLRVEKLV